MSKYFIVVAVVLAVSIPAPDSGPAQAQVAAVTSLVAGSTVGQILDDIEERVHRTISHAAASASLVADVAARTAEMALANVRQQLAADLKVAFEELEDQKESMLRELDAHVATLNAGLDAVVRFEDTLVLDASALLAQIGLPDPPGIRRVVGATLFDRPFGRHPIVLSARAFDKTNRPLKAFINGAVVPPDVVVPGGAPYELTIALPVDMVRDAFADRDQKHVVLKIETTVANPDKGLFGFWKEDDVPHTLEATLSLLPRYPVEYKMEEIVGEKAVDWNTVLWQNSDPMLVPGCGKSGCYEEHYVRARIPAGGQPTGTVRACTDSFGTHGDFETTVRSSVELATSNLFGAAATSFISSGLCPSKPPSMEPVAAYSVSGDVVTMRYLNHLHDKDRTVGFQAGYHPLIDQQLVRPIDLQQVNVENSIPLPEQPPADQATFQEAVKDVEKMAQDFALKEIEVTKVEAAADGVAVSDTAAEQAQVVFAQMVSDESISALWDAIDTNLQKIQKQLQDAITSGPHIIPNTEEPEGRGYLRYGEIYEAWFSDDMKDFTLTLRHWGGESEIYTSRVVDKMVKVQPYRVGDRTRVVVQLEAE